MFVLKFTIETGAGAAISEGKKMRILTANKANKNIKTTAKGIMY